MDNIRKGIWSEWIKKPSQDTSFAIENWMRKTGVSYKKKKMERDARDIKGLLSAAEIMKFIITFEQLIPSLL